MPPIGTALVDPAGAAIVAKWINLKGGIDGVPWTVCTDVGDSDGDGIPDNSDNCTAKSNPDQADSNNNKYGDRCDGDFDNNLVVNNADRQKLISYLGGQFSDPLGWKGWGPKYDLNGDGSIDQADLDIFNQELIGHPKGLSALRSN